jgi:hypothetical protein
MANSLELGCIKEANQSIPTGQAGQARVLDDISIVFLTKKPRTWVCEEKLTSPSALVSRPSLANQLLLSKSLAGKPNVD